MISNATTATNDLVSTETIERVSNYKTPIVRNPKFCLAVGREYCKTDYSCCGHVP